MEFQPIKGFENYLINKDGVIKNLKGQIMKPRLNSTGYYRINLQKDNKKHTILIHNLVMTTFSDIPYTKYMTVDHIDGDKKNNNFSNLRWKSMGENIELELLRNNDETIFFINELRHIYSEEELSEILKKLLDLAKLLKQGE